MQLSRLPFPSLIAVMDSLYQFPLFDIYRGASLFLLDPEVQRGKTTCPESKGLPASPILCFLSPLSLWRSAFLTLGLGQLPSPLRRAAWDCSELQEPHQLILTKALLTDTWVIQKKLEPHWACPGESEATEERQSPWKHCLGHLSSHLSSPFPLCPPRAKPSPRSMRNAA